MDESRSLHESESEADDDTDLVTEEMLLGLRFDENEKEHDLAMSHSEEVISGYIHTTDTDVESVCVKSANFFLRGVCLGAEAKPNERNILDIEVLEENKRVSYTLASLTNGVHEMSQLNVDLSLGCDAVLRLAHGTGPFYLTGLQEITYCAAPTLSDELEEPAFEEGESDDTSDEEGQEEEENVKKNAPNKAIKRKIDQGNDQNKKKVKMTKKSSKAAIEAAEDSEEESSDEESDDEMEAVSSESKKISKDKHAVGKTLSNKSRYLLPKGREVLKDVTAAKLKKKEANK
ncbi:nucleoplasmin-like protein [Watersipora subatra]|uniref:nucleoplasmin-like protein n=1 Tax=Watersipora subatra TaxID=2589382 RepID=UPI00355C408B